MFGRVAGQGTVIVSDINEAMLEEGKKRAVKLGATSCWSEERSAPPNFAWPAGAYEHPLIIGSRSGTIDYPILHAANS